MLSKESQQRFVLSRVRSSSGMVTRGRSHYSRAGEIQTGKFPQKGKSHASTDDRRDLAGMSWPICADQTRTSGQVATHHLSRNHIRELVEPKTQADPKFQSTLAFTRATGPAVHAALQDKLKDTGRNVPALRTVVNILNRLGYSLRRFQKTRPAKKFLKQTGSSTMCDRLTSDPRPIRNV